MKVKILKLVSGDDIISNGESKNNMICLKNPARLMMFPSDSGGMGMGLMPWNPYSEQEEFHIHQDHVIVEIDPPEELRNAYNEQFGSGIVTPPKNIIV
jgi:hypothetical protein